MKIPFNKPYLTGKEGMYISETVQSAKISGDGVFTKKCHTFFEDKYGFKKVLLTTSCTDALEMAAILIDVQRGDEVIMPSFTFVSTANAFVLRGAKIVFVDSCKDQPNMDVDKIEALITARTKAIVPVHYAGFACEMNKIMTIAHKYNLFVIEDAAQAVDNYCDGKVLGSFGHMSAFSFHETKNVISGEGGMLVINDERFVGRAEIIREKGTNRSSFFRGEVDKYGWVEMGSSFLPSDIIAAFLYAQLENLDIIQRKRKQIWKYYNDKLQVLADDGVFTLPIVPAGSENNAHMYYMVCNSLEERTALTSHLKGLGIHAVFHYLPLHSSPYYGEKHDGRILSNCDFFSDRLLRLPFFFELSTEMQEQVVEGITSFYNAKSR